MQVYKFMQHEKKRNWGARLSRILAKTKIGNMLPAVGAVLVMNHACQNKLSFILYRYSMFAWC